MGQLDGGREPESRRDTPAGAGAVGTRPQLEQKPDVGSRRRQAKAGAKADADADRLEQDDGSKRPKWTTGRQKPDRRDSGEGLEIRG